MLILPLSPSSPDLLHTQVAQKDSTYTHCLSKESCCFLVQCGGIIVVNGFMVQYFTFPLLTNFFSSGPPVTRLYCLSYQRSWVVTLWETILITITVV